MTDSLTFPPRLSFEGVTRLFGARAAVRDFSLAIRPGETVCLLGPSGCGKTTSLRLAAGLDRVSAGEIRIDGALVESTACHKPPEQRGIGLMFQDFALFPHMRVIDNVAFGLRGRPAEERRRIAREMLEHVDLARYAAHHPHQLSGGEQQRVALARALAPGPRIFLMDEPFSGLDPLLRESVRAQTFALLKRLGTTVLLVTHDPREAMEVADRIALIRAGALVQAGTPAELFDAPVDREAASFFGEVNVIHAFVAEAAAPTAFGAIPAAQFRDGTQVEVLVRPHAVRLTDGGTPATVVSRRRLGGEHVLELDVLPQALPPGAPPMPVMRARMADGAAPQPGETVNIGIDRERAMVFPCRSGAGARAS